MKVFTLLLFTLFSGVKPSLPSPDDCSIEIRYSLQTFNNVTTIDVRASGGSEPYYYFFFDKNNNPLTWDFKDSQYKVVNKEFPRYVKVLDAKGCLKKIELNESTNK
jgi:hypothetical protein